MQVFTKTISNVFGNERRYVIPLFQRPYVWTREFQWEPLWDDIVEKAEQELGGGQVDAPPHFLGAIVIQQRKTWGDELLAHDVIDGQQRLTTFQILLAAFRDFAVAQEEKQVAPWLASLTKNANAIASPEVEQFKVWPGRDVQQFRLVVAGGSRSAVEKVYPAVYKRRRLEPRPRMVEAYLFFYDAIAAWVQEGGAEAVSDRSKALRRVLDRRMQLVSIELDDKEDSQAIFETLNARGVPLLASDLLRNYIFQRAGGSAEAERLHRMYWTRFEVPEDAAKPDGIRFWEAEERQGRLTRARLDLFVQHYLTMKRSRDSGAGRLYQEYKAWIEEERPFTTVEEELQALTAFADQFYKLLRPETTTTLGRFAERLRILDTSTAYPLVLGLLGSQALSDAEREGILTDIESFLVRRMVCGRPIKNYNRLFLQLLRDFEAGSVATRAAFRALLAAGTGDAVDWPDDATFEKAWLTIDAYKELKPARVEMILRAIEAVMPRSKSDTVIVDDKLTVEHVMPQGWTAHWPLPAGVDPTEAAEARDDLIHDFGNLTLLAQTLNSAVSNAGPAKKLPEIVKHTGLRLNVHFQNRTTWTEQDIQDRGRDLFQIAKKVWPGP